MIFLVAIVVFVVAIIFSGYKEERYGRLKIEISKELGVSNDFFDKTGKFSNEDVKGFLQGILKDTENKSGWYYSHLREIINKILGNTDIYHKFVAQISSMVKNLSSNVDETIIVENQQEYDSYDEKKFL